MAKPVMIVKPGSVSAKDKEKLSKNGYIVIEHPFPGDVKIVSMTEGVDMDMITRAFAEGLNAFPNSSAHSAVSQHLAKAIIESKKIQP